MPRVTVTAAHDGYRTSGSSRLSFWDTVSRTLSATFVHGQVPQLVGLDPDLVTVGVGSNDIPAYDRARFDDDLGNLLGAPPPRTVIADVPGLRTASPEATQTKSLQPSGE